MTPKRVVLPIVTTKLPVRTLLGVSVVLLDLVFCVWGITLFKNWNGEIPQIYNWQQAVQQAVVEKAIDRANLWFLLRKVPLL